MFTDEELQQLQYFLAKTPLTGNESIALATILVKINRELKKGK